MRPAAQTLYLIRHGETDWNAAGRLQGGQDIDLNDTGRAQAAVVARVLRRLTPRWADLPYLASPMRRTRETMRLLRLELGLAPDDFATDPRLTEIRFGDWEGLTWGEVQAREPEAARARERDKWHFVPPGGESYEMLLARIAPVIHALPEGCVMVSHGGVMRAALVALGLAKPGRAEQFDIWQGRVLEVRPGGFVWH
jgi:probable phosphoglycerate mutase